MAKKDSGKSPNRRAPGLSKEAADDVKRGVLSGVGYRRPPEHTRFKKGQSGNPRGRPKRYHAGGSSQARDLFLKQTERLVTIREGEETRQIPAIEAVHYAAIKSALSGNAYAQKHVTERHFWADRERRAEIEASNESWRRYVAWHREQITKAERNGEPPPAPLPHPDDVVIDAEEGVRFIGPVDETQAESLEKAIKIRDLLIMQDALDHCLAEDTEGEDQPGTALLFAMLLDKSVPARFRLSKADWTERMMRYDRMPKRALLKAVYGAWKALGRRVPRGRTHPPLRWGEQQAENLTVAFSEISGHHRSSA